MCPQITRYSEAGTPSSPALACRYNDGIVVRSRRSPARQCQAASASDNRRRRDVQCGRPLSGTLHRADREQLPEIDEDEAWNALVDDLEHVSCMSNTHD